MNITLDKFNSLKSDTVFGWSWKIALVIFCGILLALVFFWSKLPPQIPFFYSLPWGEEQLASPFNLLLLVFASGLLFVINTIIAVFTQKSVPYFSKIIIVTGVIVILLTAFTTLQIIFLVT